MKEPQRIKLTDSPINKRVDLIPLTSNSQYNIETIDDIYSKNILKNINENNQQNNSESISELESL